MNWLKSFKDTSLKIVSEYKQGLDDFMASLNNDLNTIISSIEDNLVNDTHDSKNNLIMKANKNNNMHSCKENSKKEDNIHTSCDNPSSNNYKNHSILREIVETILPNRRSITIQKIEKIVENIEKTGDFIRKDPSNLLLIDRNDFTNFTMFYELYKNNSIILQKLMQYNPALINLLPDDQTQDNKQEAIDKFLLRFLYFTVYYIESEMRSTPDPIEYPESKNNLTNENTDNFNEEDISSQSVNNASPIEIPTSTAGVLDAIQPRKCDSPVRVSKSVSPSSSFSEISLAKNSNSSSSSSEEEKYIEYSNHNNDKSSNDDKSLSSRENDDWQIDDPILRI